MIIKTNQSLLKRNRRVAQICSLSGLTILIAGMLISIRMPDKVFIAMSALVAGFILSQIGIYFTNRWGRSPRPDELLNQALKGLDDKYHLIHYLTPVSHLLVGPAGIWILSVKYQKGKITFSNGRWHQKGGNLYLKIFGQEGLGRPDLELGFEVEKINKYLKKILPDDQLNSKTALIFSNEKTEIQLDESQNPLAPTLHISKLKEFIRKNAKNKPISMEKLEEVQNALSSVT
jgi:hypothetical protein